MYKRLGIYILIISLIVGISMHWRSQRGLQFQATDTIFLPEKTAYQSRILLMPLDSRPPCTQFVEQLAAIAGISILVPPQEKLDQYEKTADPQAMQEWFLSQAASVDTAIVSMDMLLHGGLLASRMYSREADVLPAALDVLKKAKEINPRLKLYVFSIIPRLIVANTAENMPYQRNMMKYSVQKDIVLTFENPQDYYKMQQIESTLPSVLLTRYANLYEHNKRLNYALIDLAAQGEIDGLIIGQDDGYPFGIPNMMKQAVQHYAKQSGSEDKIFVTRGTDEVALTMLAHIITRGRNYQPRIYVEYSHAAVSSIVMPYMPHSVDTTVDEKIHIVNGQRVSSPDLADYTLFVHVGTQDMSPRILEKAADRVRNLLDSGNRIAIVDLSENYYASDTLFPVLFRQDFPLLQLSAYAGWNTTSNSIGTALAQISIAGAMSSVESFDKGFSSWIANTEFLLCRFFDDWYFQKEFQSQLNRSLERAGISPYHLGVHYGIISQAAEKMIIQKAQYWKYRQIDGQIIKVNIAGRPEQFFISDFSFKAKLPWERTFEIRLEPRITVHRMK